jgi:NAD(P)-dependent dehydrogenase (short-subunit alcohol dehydrogenase family)
MKSVILVTGASTGIGYLTVRSLAQAGHTVYASMRKHRRPQRAQGA